MQLIPLNESIYFNATQMSLIYVYLLAFTYHPAYPNILYLLYGQRNQVVNTYDSMHLLARDSNTGTFIQNDTFTVDYHCLIDCEIKATPTFFIIESQSMIGVYTIAPNNSAVDLSVHYYLVSKISISYANDVITRFADIHADKFVIVDSPGQQIVIGNSSQRNPVSYPFNFNGNAVLFVGMYENRIAVVMNASRVTYYLFCLACMLNGSNYSAPFIIQTPNRLTVTSAFRLYRGFPLVNSQLIDGVIYWGFNSAQTSPMIIANDTNFWTLLYLSTAGLYSAANHQNLLFFGEDEMIYNHKFDHDDTNASAYRYGTVVKKMAIANDSSLVTVKDSLSNWRINQYQFVVNCNSYSAVPSNNPFICDCQIYNSAHQCSTVNQSSNSSAMNNQTNASSNISRPITPIVNTTTGNQTDISTASEEKGSFPIGAVIGVIAGLVVLTVSIIIIKKNYQRCIKGRRRTPWKYNPVELMSFQT